MIFLFTILNKWGDNGMTVNNFGNILATVRKAKGMKQSEAASGIVTRSYLSQLESDRNKISLEVFIKLLDKYNTSLYEFEYLLQETENMVVKTNHLVDIQNIMYEYSIHEIEAYHQKFLNVEKNIYLHEYHMKILSQIVLLYRQKGKVEKKIYQDLMTYLFKVDIWGLYELHLLVNLVNMIDYRDNQTFYRQIEKKLTNTRFPEKDKLLSQLYLNLSNVALDVKDYHNVYSFVEKGLEYTRKYNYIFEQILLNLNYHIAKSIQNITLDKMIYNYLNMLQYLGYPQIIQRVKKELNKHNFSL